MDEQGFTLLEILIALTIAGIILGSIFIFFNLSFSSWQRADTDGNWEQGWRVLEASFHRDLSNLFYSNIYSKNVFSGQNQELELLVLEEDRLKKVNYYFNSYKNQLVRKIIPIDGDKNVQEVSFFSRINLERVSFSFEDRDTNYWRNSWSYQGRKVLPGAVKISITAKDIQLPTLVEEIYVGKKILD